MAKIFTKTVVVDEVLTEDARYNILEDGGGAFKADMQINLTTPVSVAGTDVNAALLNPLETAVDTLDDMLVTYTTGGTDTAYTLTTPQAPALATHERWRVTFNATAGSTPTLNRDSKGAKALKYYDSAGVKQSCGATTIISGMISDVVYDGTDYVLIDSLPPAGGTISDNSLALAKLINATAQYNLIGRSTAGSGAWEEKATSANVFSLLGAADYAAMRTLLGLVIGTNVQAYDADLDSWSGKTAPTGTVVGTSDTQTLTNKRITKRSVTVTVAAEPAINTDNGDVFRIGVTGDLVDLAITSLTTNLTGTPTHGQMICLEFLDDGTARSITHGASFRAGTNFTLLTTTTLSKLCRELFQWDSADSKWDCVGVWIEA